MTNDETGGEEPIPGEQLAVVTVIFEGVLLLAAIGLGHVLGVDPLKDVALLWQDIFFGLVGGIALTAAIVVLIDVPWRLMDGIRRDADILVRRLKTLGVAQIAVISIAAGVAEEVFFRGLLQVYFSGLFGPWSGLLLASALFGLVHFVSVSYVVYVFLFGLVIGGLYWWTGDLTGPVVGHAVYDFGALYWAIHIRKYQAQPPG